MTAVLGKQELKLVFLIVNGQILYVKFLGVNIRATFAQYIFINDTFMKFEIFQMIILYPHGEKSWQNLRKISFLIQKII